MENFANIATVERDTGLGKDTLRVWERRYGFPQPVRGPNGDRLYPPEQIARLRLIKRLMDMGYRPGKLVGTPDEELRALSALVPQAVPEDGDEAILGGIITLLRSHQLSLLRHQLHQCMMRQGLQRFVMESIPVINRIVGEAWGRGELEVFEEHLYTEQMQALLRQAIATLPAGCERPSILLTTVPEEPHILGLLMIEALFALDGAHCISLGTQTPLDDIRAAATAHRVDAVALSFSGAFPARQVAPLVRQLRSLLPAEIALWVGGSGAERLPAMAGVDVATTLVAALDLLAALRARATH